MNLEPGKLQDVVMTSFKGFHSVVERQKRWRASQYGQKGNAQGMHQWTHFVTTCCHNKGINPVPRGLPAIKIVILIQSLGAYQLPHEARLPTLLNWEPRF